MLIEPHFLAEAVRKAAPDPHPLPCLWLVSVTASVHCDADCVTRPALTHLIYLCHDLSSAHQK